MFGMGLGINSHQRLPTIAVGSSRFVPGILSSKSLRTKLMKESRYLYEVGRYDDALQLLNIAFEATPDTKPAYYVPLCDIAAAIYFEQNDLKSCQEFNEKSQQIRQASFEGLTCKRMFHYQNLGNLAAAQGNCEKALKHYEKSVEKLMDYELQYKEKDMILEIYCMMTGHIYFLDGDDDNAMKRFTEAVKMLERYEHEAAPLYAR